MAQRFLGVCALAFSVSVFATPQTIRVDGSVFDNTGIPSTGSKDIQIKLYSASTGGSALWTSSVYNTTVASGRFSINLDGSTLTPYLAALATSGTAYFEIVVDTGTANGSMDTPITVTPRIRARGTAFALAASVADTLTGVSATSAEFNYLSGVTGRLQTQINSIVGGTADSFANLTDAATISVDGSNARIYKVTLGGNRTMGNPTTTVSGRLYTFIVNQDGTGGRQVSWDTKYKGVIPAPVNSIYVSSATGTPIGNMTGGGGLATGFDGNTNQGYWGGGPTGSGAGTGYIGKDWGSGNVKYLSRAVVYPTNNQGYGSGMTNVRFTVQGSQNNSTWTTLYTSAYITNASSGNTDLTGFSNGVGYRYHRIAIDDAGGAATAGISEVEFYENLPIAGSTATYSFVSDGTNLYYTNDPTVAGSGGTAVTKYTASRAMEIDANGNASASAVLSSELGYLSGVTANIQTQISSIPSASTRLPLVGGSLSGALNSGSTITSTGTITGNAVNVSGASSGSRFAMLDSSKNIVSSASTTTDTEFSYLSGVTSNLGLKINRFTATEASYLAGATSGLQAQINALGATGGGGKLDIAGGTMTGGLGLNYTGAGANGVVYTDASRKLQTSSTVDATELGFLDGVTSALDQKVNRFTVAEAGYLAGVTSSLGNKLNLFTVTDASYLSGLTANVQTQLNTKLTATDVAGKLDKGSDTMTGSLGLAYANVTPDRVAYVDASRILRTDANVDSTELSYLDGVTSSLSARLNGVTASLAPVAVALQGVTGSTLGGFLNGVTTSLAPIARALQGVTGVVLGDYLGGISANIQTQLNAKAVGTNYVAKVGDTMNGDLGLAGPAAATVSRVLYLDASRKIATSSTSDTEVGYLAGVTASLASRLNGVTASLMKTNLFSATEASYLAGVTSDLQGQINAKATGANYVAKIGDTMSGALSVPAGAVSTVSLRLGNDPATGIYRPAANQVGLAVAGTAGLVVSTSGAAIAGQIASTQATPITGATVDFNTGNVQVLTNVGASTIALNNMVAGSSYTVVVSDTTSRQYTFTGCTSAFIPSNGYTTAGASTIYSILYVTISAVNYCYISWLSGF